MFATEFNRFKEEFTIIFSKVVEKINNDPNGYKLFYNFKVKEMADETINFILNEMTKGFYPFKRASKHYLFEDIELLMTVEGFIRQYGYQLQYVEKVDDWGSRFKIVRIS